MSEGGEDSGEKSYEASQQRLDDARRKGDIPKSTDLTAAAAYFGLLIALGIAGASAVAAMGAVLMTMLSRADTMAPRMLSMGGSALSMEVAGQALLPIAAIFGLPFLLVLLTLIAQRAIVVAPDKLAPKASRVSPLAQAKNKFGITGLFEFAKSTFKLVLISIVLAIFLANETDHIVGLSRADPMAVPGEMASLAMGLLTQIAIIALIIAAFDYLWQRFDHARKLRMSHQDVKEEHKKSEGDPMIKSQRRQRAEEIANNQMMLDVPKSDVVIVNPSHYAVALKWDRAAGGAPVVAAKGVDGIALRIREAASAANVPIHHDPPTARALEATAEIGGEIDPEHYQAVAAAIRFSEAMRRKARERGT